MPQACPAEFLRRVGVLLSSSAVCRLCRQGPGATIRGHADWRKGAVGLCAQFQSRRCLAYPPLLHLQRARTPAYRTRGRIQIVEFIACHNKVEGLAGFIADIPWRRQRGYCGHILMLGLGLCFWRNENGRLMGTVPRCSFARPPVRGVSRG